MVGKVYGYLPGSGQQGADDEQKCALRGFGVQEADIYMDVPDGQTAEDASRPAFRELLGKIQPGDTLAVATLDGLGKNYGEILARWQQLVEEKRAAIVVLDMPLLDTRGRRTLDGAQLGRLVPQLLARMAKVEYDFFRQCQAKGIAAAKARGVRFGRRPMARPESYDMLFQAWRQGRISARGAAKFLGIDHHTFLNWARG